MSLCTRSQYSETQLHITLSRTVRSRESNFAKARFDLLMRSASAAAAFEGEGCEGMVTPSSTLLKQGHIRTQTLTHGVCITRVTQLISPALLYDGFQLREA